MTYSAIETSREDGNVLELYKFTFGAVTTRLTSYNQDIIFQGLKERLEKFRTFKVFMDICVRLVKQCRRRSFYAVPIAGVGQHGGEAGSALIQTADSYLMS